MWGPWTTRFLSFLVFILGIMTWPYSKIFGLTVKKRKIPPISNPLLTKKASELAEMIRKREVSSTTIMKTFIERIEIVNPILNCLVQDRFDIALKEANNADKMIEANPSPEYWAKTKPLLGVPMTIKETISVKGMSNNGGRLRPKEHIAEEDSLAVKNLKEAGVIPIAVTNTPELCYFWETFNYATGVTKNPHDTRRTAGGSSGGEAALLSVGGSVIGLGSDVAGSGRLPPMFCGVFGHKPTSRISPVLGHMPQSTDPDWDTFLAFSPLARSASDLSLVLRCVAPQESKQLRLEEPVDLKKLKIYYMEECISPMLQKVDPEMKAAVYKAAAHFKKYGIEPKKVVVNGFAEALGPSMAIMVSMESPQNVCQRSEDTNDWTLWTVLGELLRICFGFGRVALYSLGYCLLKLYFNLYSKQKLEECKKEKEQLLKYFEELLGDDGVLILPTFVTSAPLHYRMYSKILNTIYLIIFNLLEMPATACPMGFTMNGMPIGVQIAGYKYQDRLTLAVANELEQAFGGWTPPISQPNNNMV